MSIFCKHEWIYGYYSFGHGERYLKGCKKCNKVVEISLHAVQKAMFLGHEVKKINRVWE